MYVEWGASGHIGDDAGEAYYSLEGTSNAFSIHAFVNRNNFEVQVKFDNIETQNNTKGSSVDVGFEWNDSRNFILSGTQGRYSSNYPPTDWMHENLETLGNRKLRHICMPGTHNSGMSVLGKTSSPFVTPRNTVTQVFDVYHQLKAGARFFDIRPVISGGQFFTGHYSPNDLLGWLGGNGQSLAEVIDQINRFTNEYHELVILKVSHTLNTDNGPRNYTQFNQDEWNRLFEELKRINARLVNEVTGNEDLTQWPLHRFIGSDRAAVLIIANEVDNGVTGSYQKEGMFSRDNFPSLFDSYANSNQLSIMQEDQLRKLKDSRNVVPDDKARKEGFFLLSWFLTLQGVENISSLPENSLLSISAGRTYTPLFEVFNFFTPESFPNVLYLDGFGHRHSRPRPLRPTPQRGGRSAVDAINFEVTALALAINEVAGKNKYITG